MIYKIEDPGQGVSYVISSNGVWLPGSYDSKKTANYAFRFKEVILYKLEQSINHNGKVITYEDLKESGKKC